MWDMTRWSPYVVGGLIGVLSWFTFVFSNRPLGISTAYAETAGMIERAFRGDEVMQRAYYQKYPPVIGWGWMLAVGVVVGGFISAVLSGDFELELVPPLWEVRFGHTPLLRLAVAFVGGTLLGLGARWAGGCTSGHGISGTLQLVVASWVAVLCFFIGGTVTAMLMFQPFD